MPTTSERTRGYESDFQSFEFDDMPPPEQRKSFDPLASVRMFQDDLRKFGTVLPETRDRVRDEELSLLSEAVDRASRTEFPLHRIGDDLTYFKNGEWRSYTGMLIVGLEVADLEAAVDPRKQFLADAAANDLAHGYAMRKLQPGQQLVWTSPYDTDIEERYGADFMKKCGRFPDRRMSFIYRAYCGETGDVILESQSLDGGDLEAIAAAVELAENNPQADMDDMVDAHDAVLVQKHGGEFYAGRRDAEITENAWKQILAQDDLVNFFLNKLEGLAGERLNGDQMELAVKRHMYGAWAAFKQRIDGKAPPRYASSTEPGHVTIIGNMLLEEEVRSAFNRFVSEGQMLVGCGGVISFAQYEYTVMHTSGEAVASAIFGKDEDKFGALSFTCTKGHHNRRKRGQPPIAVCKRCLMDVSCGMKDAV